jgi:transposase
MSLFQALFFAYVQYDTPMARRFIQPDYEATLREPIYIEEVLPPTHLARWLACLIATWDLTPFYERYALFGRPPYAPEILLGVLLYGYLTGLHHPEEIAQAIKESLPFRFLAAGTHPDASTIGRFRDSTLPLVAGLFAQVLARARADGFLSANPPVSVDGTKIAANASKHQAVSYRHACLLRDQWLRQAAELWEKPEAALPAGMDPLQEIALRLEALDQLNLAIAVIEARAHQRYQAAKAEYDAKMAARAQREKETGRKLGGRPPTPPSPTPQSDEQYNFTDPASRIMKNSGDTGVSQQYNAQAAVAHGVGGTVGRFIVGYGLSDHPNDKLEGTTAIDHIPPCVGMPVAAAEDNGYFSEQNVRAITARGIIPLISEGKQKHGLNWERFHQTRENAPIPDDASPVERMRAARESAFGHAIYTQRKSTVEPVFGIIKSILDFWQFSVRGILKALWEWGLVCLTYDIKRLYTCQARARKQTESSCCAFTTKLAQFACSISRGWRGLGKAKHSDHCRPLTSRRTITRLASPTAGGSFASGC